MECLLLFEKIYLSGMLTNKLIKAPKITLYRLHTVLQPGLTKLVQEDSNENQNAGYAHC